MSRPMRSFFLVFLSFALAAPAQAASAPRIENWAGEAAWRKLETQGVKIGSIEVVVRGVFPVTGMAQPWYEKLTNKLHIETAEPVILAHLLFKVGDTVSARRIYETERRLRALKYVREAAIEPGAVTKAGVVARIVIDDAWSLKLNASYDSTGGQAASGFSIEDSNFLGSGKSLSVAKTSSVLRDSTSISVSDPSFFGSHWTVDAHATKSTDGDSNGIRVALPFVRTDSPWAGAAAFDVTSDELLFWNAGAEAWIATSERQLHSVEAGKLLKWSGDSGWRMRFGIRSEYFDYGTPVAIDASLRPAPVLTDRILNGATFSIERFHDHYQTFKNLALVDRYEDYNLGFDAKLEVGRFPAFAGSTVDSETIELTSDWAGRFGQDDLLLLDGTFSTRHESTNGAVDDYFSAVGTYYLRRFDPHTLVTRLQFEMRDNPDPEHELYLGGSDGLYGYPNFYKYGDRRWTLHVEDRILSDKILWNSFHIGYSAFFEAGQIRENTATGAEWSKFYADIGGGYRIGSLRGAFGSVLYFMVAVPLVRDPGMDSYQVVIGTSIDY